MIAPWVQQYTKCCLVEIDCLTRVVCFVKIDKEGDKKSQKIIQELENIDDECEEKEIDFVKTSDEGTEKEFGIPTLPALAFYKNKFKKIYTGNCCHTLILQNYSFFEAVKKNSYYCRLCLRETFTNGFFYNMLSSYCVQFRP